MAGTVKEMSLIKQVLQLKQLGESNRGIARKLPINKETVNGYHRNTQIHYFIQSIKLFVRSHAHNCFTHSYL